MFRRGPRWSPDIKNGRGLLLVDLLDAQMFRRGPRWSPDIKNGRGRLLVDLLDAHAHGEPKMELCHHHGGVRLLVDLLQFAEEPLLIVIIYLRAFPLHELGGF